MAERYSKFLLAINALSNLSTIYGDSDVGIWDINGRQELNAAGRGSFKMYASDVGLMTAIEDNIGQVVTVYVTDQVASGAAMDLATFIIKSITTETDEGVSVVTVSGPEITDQLRNTNAGNNAIDNGAGGPSTTDVTDIMGYASAGWSLTGATATAAGTYHASKGDTVLKLLNATAQQSGEIFRLATYANPTSKGLFWTASPDSSGVSLQMPTSYNQYDGSTTVGKLYSLRREYDFEPVVTRIRPYGAGLGDGRLGITGISAANTGADPAGITTTFASNLIVNTSLEASLGYVIAQDVDFSWIQANDPTNATQMTSAAVAVWKTAINYLLQNDASREFYTAVCNVAANLRPGQDVVLSYSEYQGGITGGSQTINISLHLTILSVENRFEDGERITTLTLGDKPLPQPTAAQWVADVAEKTQDTTRKSDVGTSPGAVSTGRTINATQPVRIDGGAAADLSADRTISINGLTTVGAANRIPGTNAGATAWEYKAVTAGTGISVGHTAGAITITNTSPGSGDISGLAYVTIGNTASLSAERALTAGDGLDLTDGGANSTVTLAVDVTDFVGDGLVEVATNNVALGTPGSSTATSTNAVTASSHTHAIDSTIARSTITIAAGNGLTGGGDLTANRTITMGTPGTLTVSTSNEVTASSHTHAITSSSNPGAAASILASDASGHLQLVRIGAGVSPSFPMHAVSAANSEALYVVANSLTSGVALTMEAPLSTTNDNGKTFQIKVASEGWGRVMFYSDGKFGVGGGSANRDTFLSRSAANTWLVSSDGGSGTANIRLNDDGWIGLGSSAARIVFDDQATDQIEVRNAMMIINSATPDTRTLATSYLQVIDGDISISSSGVATGAMYGAYAYGTGIPGSARFIGRRARGTRASPTATQSGDEIAKFGGGGYDGSNFGDARAYMAVLASNNYTSISQGGRLLFYTTPTGSTTEAVVVSIEGNGDFVKYNTTETFKLIDSGSAGASGSGTITDWIEVQVGGVTGYLKVYNAK